MAQPEPIIIRILRLIRDEGPLSPEKIRQKLGITSRMTVHPLISILRTLGLVSYYVDEHGEKWQGVYIIEPLGKEVLKKIDEKQTR